jgi:hypothetical protein
MKSLQIRILTGEITVPKTARYKELYNKTKKWRHADGAQNYDYNKGWNNAAQFNQEHYLDEDTDTADLIFPEANINQNTIELINQFFEIFNKEVYNTSSLSPGFDDKKFVLFIKREYTDVNSDAFKNLSKKFWPFKRLVWFFIKSGFRDAAFSFPQGHADKHCGTAFIWTESPLDEVVSHELGHLYGLDHWGDTRDPLKLINNKASYYQRNNQWAPIMGISLLSSQNSQWSNGNYLPKWPGFQDDILTISKHGSLIKPPIKQTNSVYFNNVRNLKNAKKMARILNENSATAIGMIGFPYDYDIIKVIVPAGASLLTIKPVETNSKMPDFDCDILYCDCELDKDKDKTNMSADFDTYWAPDGEVNILRKIVINNDDKYVSRSLHNDNSKEIQFDFNFEYTSLIYLRIRGDFIDPVNKKNEEEPVQEDKGQDRYGSVGKYRINVTTDSTAFNDDIPNTHCEKFNICVNGEYQQIPLFVQDEKDEQIDGTEGGVHIFETDVLINGEKKKKRFLVIGYPLDMNQKEIEGRFYLPVIINNECKKYAFVRGIST